MPIWLVEVPECDWDEYDAFVVRAASASSAVELVRSQFTKSQGEPTASLVLPDGPDAKILGSFNAG
jgi:hypothetical protein